MRKRKFSVIGVVMLLMTSLVVLSCASDDEIDTGENFRMLYGRWVLLGYVSNGNYVDYEDSGTKECYLLLEEDGSYNGRFCNSLQGEYSFNQNGEFLILSCISTMIWSTDSELMFMEEQIGQKKIRSFEMEGNCLKLYYSKNDYLKFSR